MVLPVLTGHRLGKPLFYCTPGVNHSTPSSSAIAGGDFQRAAFPDLPPQSAIGVASYSEESIELIA